MSLADTRRAERRLKKAREQLGQHPWRRSAQDEYLQASLHRAKAQKEQEAPGEQPVLFEETP